LVSNNRFICRPENLAGNLRQVMVILPNDSNVALGVCDSGCVYQQPLQLDQRRQIDAWRAHGHSSTNRGIEHPSDDRDQQARYEAGLAERRYAACDPDNRLIAAQLEKNWEVALRRVRDLEASTVRDVA
jgi:hypothetical protein